MVNKEHVTYNKTYGPVISGNIGFMEFWPPDGHQLCLGPYGIIKLHIALITGP